MKSFVPLTRIAREAVDIALDDSSLAIDATVGNGHDTLFLAGRVSPKGHVVGFDVQPQALEAVRSRLAASGLESVATLHLLGHEHMLEKIPQQWHGRVSAVMFNLGYLPGGNKALTTAPDTTVSALDQALNLLSPGGLISLLVYRGHAGSRTEADAVLAWLDRLDRRHAVRHHESPGPVLHLIQRTG